ncbi:hypothetical protein OG216_09980 [Streptomycetaceae bacterium NBC_01309]
MNESTRPDPKVQISALSEVGRLMVEHDLPAVDVHVRADGVTVGLEAYDHAQHHGGPASVGDMLAMFEAWAAVLGAGEYARHVSTTLGADGVWHQSASFWADFAGRRWGFHGAAAVPVPLVRRSPRVRTAVSA